jgi:hypothetical protein
MAIDYAYDINISDDKKHVTLVVELPERELAREPILEMNDANALDIIRENGFGTYTLVHAGGHLTNWVSREGVGGNRRGEWIFEKPVVKKATAKKTVTTSATATTVSTAKTAKTTKTKTTKTNS